MSASVLFIAGEASGDAHAARVVRELHTTAPELRVFAAGGPTMAAAGAELLLDLTEHAVVGLVEVLKNYGTFKRIFDDLLDAVAERQPAAVVLVDFPGFNLRFARAVKRRFPQVKVIYYISPQLWAWHASRARQIERDVDLMLTIFPFEKDWYARHAPRLKVEFVGHPLIDKMQADEDSTVKRADRLVLLLPGSREREVSQLFPILTRVVEQLPGNVQFVCAAASQKLARQMQHPRIKVQVGGAHELMQQATLAIAASGTVTMECAYFRCPMIVLYKVNWLTYWIGRAVVTVNWLAMPNVIANRAIVPEFIQHDATPSKIVVAASSLLAQLDQRKTMQRELDQVIRSLGGPGASQRAAAAIAASL